MVNFGFNDSGGYGDAGFQGTVVLTGNGVPPSPLDGRYDYVYGDGLPTGSYLEFRNNVDLASDPQGQNTGMDWSFTFPAAEQSDTPALISLDDFGFYFDANAYDQPDPESIAPLLSIQEVSVPEPASVGVLALAGVGLLGRSRRRVKV